MGTREKAAIGHMSSGYTVALAHAKQDLHDALEEQTLIERRGEELKESITTLRRVVAGLSALCGESFEWNDMGITEACWQVLEQATVLLTTTQVIEALEALGFSLKTQKNATASVMAVLQRMAVARKIDRLSHAGKTYWRGPRAIGPTEEGPA